MTIKLRRRNARYRDLTIGAGRPYLYSPGIFKVLDAREPGDWEYGDDGERYAYPKPLNNVGFFEDFFDDKPKAVRTFWRVMNQRLAGIGEGHSLGTQANEALEAQRVQK